MQQYIIQYKNFLVLGILVCFSVVCFSQTKRGTVVFSGMYHTQIFAGETRFEKGYGLNYQYFVMDNLAVEYNLSYVSVPNNLNYFKLHGGAVLAGYMSSLAITNFLNEGYWALATIAAIVPEGISYHIPINDKLTISPYANLLSFDWSEGYLHYNNSFGLRMNMTVLNHLNIAPFAFTQIQYRNKALGGTRTGFGMGAMLGWKF